MSHGYNNVPFLLHLFAKVLQFNHNLEAGMVLFLVIVRRRVLIFVPHHICKIKSHLSEEGAQISPVIHRI